MFYDFNDAVSDNINTIIPDGTIAKVKLQIKPGGYSDPDHGWLDGFATKSDNTNSIYLACCFTVLASVTGEYIGRKVWSNIGLYSSKNDNKWGEMGRSFIRSILNSAKGFSDKDTSEAAKQARVIDDFADLDNLELVVRIEIETDKDGTERNIIKRALGPEHSVYDKLMSGIDITNKGWN